MKHKLIRLFIFFVFFLIYIQASAQDQYNGEIGINGGGSYYLGDANSKLFSNMQGAYSGYFRYCIDQRFAAKIELTNATISGSNPDFSNNIISADLTGEFNFFDLEKNEYKQFSKIFSPYIFAGVGVMNYNFLKSRQANPSIPFGLGIKVKLSSRWNFNVQWTNRLLMADDLEGVTALKNIGGLNGSNPFNKDMLSTITVGISLNIWKKYCDCLNSTIMPESHKFKK